MSITLISSPGTYRPAYNPIQWVFNSSNVAECDFEYVVDLLINGVFAARFSTLPIGDDYYGYFEVQATIRGYLSQNPHLAPDGWFTNDKCMVAYQIKVYERYNTSLDCSGSSTLSSVLYTSATCYAFNAALQYHEYKAYTQTTFLAANKQSKFLTDMPNRALIPMDASFALGFIQYAGGGAEDQVFTMEIKTYDKNHVLIDSYLYDNPKYVPANAGELLMSVGVGPVDLNEATLAGSPMPAQPIITDNVGFYSLTLLNSSNDVVSETKEFQIDRRCSIYPRHRIWWKNPKGQYDSYTFNLRSIRGMSVERSTFQKLLDVDYSIGDRGETVIDVNAIERFTFNSNWLTESEDQWVKQLLVSSDVYVNYDDSKLVRRNIMSGACFLPPSFEITGLIHDSGFAMLYITEGSPGSIPDGTYFDYTSVGAGFAAIGSPASGTHKQIISYNSGFGYYVTNIVSTIDPMSGIIESGTLTPEGASPSTGLVLEPGEIIPDGTEFTYQVDDGSALGMPNTGTASVIEYDAINDMYMTTIPCTNEVGAILNGFIRFKKIDIKLIPIIITTSTFEDKKVLDAVNIQRTVEARPSYKVNTNP